jgi:hypothetical protein
MIKFFRKIRQKMLTENKFSKYLIYAIGEIILVVIGILIALQINEYKANRNIQSEEIEFLNFVKQDLHKDLENLKNVSGFKKMQFDNCKKIIEYYKHSVESIKDTLDFVDKIISTFYLINENPSNTAFETAKLSGGIQKYKNKTLMNLLSTYYSDNEMNLQLIETRRYTNSYAENVFFNRYVILGKSVYLAGGISSEFMKIYEDDPRAATVDWIADFREDFRMENYFQGMIIRLQLDTNSLDEREKQAKYLVVLIDEYINSVQ